MTSNTPAAAPQPTPADVAPGVHIDVRPQRYIGGEFVTLCTCGETFTGQDPDEADSAQFEHRDAAEEAGGKPARSAGRAAVIVRASESHEDGDEVALQDLLTDLQHFADVVGIGWAEVIERAAGMHADEVAEQG